MKNLIREAVAPMTIPSKIIFPEGGGRAREVVKRSNYGHVYKFPSKKCGRTVHPEYGLEYDRAYLLEMDIDVVWFQEQPCRIDYADNGVVRKMYPDYLVKRRDGSLTIEEVKLHDDAEKDDFKRRIEIEEKIVVANGYRFEKKTEKYIRVEPRLSNAKSLRPYQRLNINPLLREKVIELLRLDFHTGSVLLSKVSKLSEEALLAMVSQCVVGVDLNQPLGAESLFYNVQ